MAAISVGLFPIAILGTDRPEIFDEVVRHTGPERPLAAWFRPTPLFD